MRRVFLVCVAQATSSRVCCGKLLAPQPPLWGYSLSSRQADESVLLCRQAEKQRVPYKPEERSDTSACSKGQNRTHWKEVLPAMMMSYNCHVHRATEESPFFLTHLNNPWVSVFNLSRPNPLYSTGYVERAFHNMEVSYKFARENLILAEDDRKAYFDKSQAHASKRLIGEIKS